MTMKTKKVTNIYTHIADLLLAAFEFLLLFYLATALVSIESSLGWFAPTIENIFFGQIINYFVVGVILEVIYQKIKGDEDEETL